MFLLFLFLIVSSYSMSSNFTQSNTTPAYNCGGGIPCRTICPPHCYCYKVSANCYCVGPCW